MNDLSVLFPVPVAVSLGPWSGTAVCLQLRDLARLQTIVSGLTGDPLAGRRLSLIEAKVAAGGDYLADSAEGLAYGDRLREAIRAVNDWPPLLGSPRADALLETTAGQILWLDVLLSRTNPGFTAQVAVDLLPHGTAEEWLLLRQVAYADHPGDWILRLAEPMPQRRSKAGSWGETVDEIVREMGWTYNEVGNLYLSQFFSLRSGGKWNPGTITKTRENAAWYRRATERLRRLVTGRRNGTGH